MDVSHIFDGLNDEQRNAVGAPDGSLLVLAGAGSGKTRVLTNRIAFLIQGLQVSPFSILAVTFTNKAAREMRERVESILNIPAHGMWIGTFHSICHRLLRMHYQESGLPESFEIIDSDDQYRLIRRILKEQNLDEAYWPPKQLQWMINSHKEEGRRAQQLPSGNDPQQRILHQVYVSYEEMCQRFGLVDFAEIMLRTLELLKNNQAIREHYQQRFESVLVDEFQDTNSIQYQWLKLLSARKQNLFAVGDDDQSIYGWRGARVENILNFKNDFPQATSIRLEQNYRSTGTILNAANAVISNNQDRMGKDLWTDSGEGDKIKLYTATNEIDEARFVVEQIMQWVEHGNRRDEVAILYRSNAQSRVFEEQLLQHGVPYRVYGGLRFFERAEIKDALAYLRLISNQNSDPAFERIVNVPTRGIGNKTLEMIREAARVNNLSLWQGAIAMLEQKQLPPRAHSAVHAFIEIIQRLKNDCQQFELGETVDHTLKLSGLLAHYKAEKGERAQSKVENLEELVNAARNFTIDEDEPLDALSVFLSNAALEAGEGQAEKWQDCVQLMSLHSAKGLEFPLVFLCGMEEGLFPHQRSLEEDGRLEEERRLCYVGMTRAMQQLFICYAEIRRLYGREHYTQASRFIGEIPSEYLNEIRSSNFSRYSYATTTSNATQNENTTGLNPGQLVRHPKFGDGVIINLEGHGEHARVQVNFQQAGTKWLISAYANLEAL